MMKNIGIGMKTLKIYKIDTFINKINMNMSNQIYEKFFVYLPEKIKFKLEHNNIFNDLVSQIKGLNKIKIEDNNIHLWCDNKYIMTESKFIIIRYLSKISKSVF